MGNRQDRKLHRDFEAIFHRMLKAGWLHSFTETKGKGWHLTWNPAGADASMTLKKIIDELALDQADERPMMAYEFANGFTPHPASNAATVSGFLEILRAAEYVSHASFRNGVTEIVWTNLGTVRMGTFAYHLDQLGIGHEVDPVFTLVHVIAGWAPDKDTGFRIG